MGTATRTKRSASTKGGAPRNEDRRAPGKATTATLRAAIYLRISNDPEGERAGVERQRAACEELVAARGWTLVDTYEDNDTSAYSGKPRKHFERLLTDVAAGQVDVVVAWASDRLYRRMADLLRITADLAPRARIVTVTGGGFVDLTSAEGILNAQVQGSVGEFESRHKGERVAARALQRATVEHRTTASRRPFGWCWADPDPGNPERPRKGTREGLLVLEREAAAVRRIFDMVAAGGTVMGATRWLRESGFTGPRGATVSTELVRSILTNPRNAGLAHYRGEVVGEAADGLRIVEVDTFEKVRTILSDPARRTTPGRPAGSLMSGIARCGKCNGPMNANMKLEPTGVRRPVYVCQHHRHLSRRRDRVDPAIVELVAEYLRRNASRLRRYAAPSPGRAATRAADDVAALRDRLDVLAALVAAGDLDPVDYGPAAREVRARLADAERRAVTVSGRPAVARLLTADDVEAAWRSLVADDVEGARTVLRELVEKVVILPAAASHRPAVTDMRVDWRDLGATP